MSYLPLVVLFTYPLFSLLLTSRYDNAEHMLFKQNSCGVAVVAGQTVVAVSSVVAERLVVAGNDKSINVMAYFLQRIYYTIF